jgi:hypothetical protein
MLTQRGTSPFAFRCRLAFSRLPICATSLRLQPEIGFGFAVMGWPLDVNMIGHAVANGHSRGHALKFGEKCVTIN